LHKLALKMKALMEVIYLVLLHDELDVCATCWGDLEFVLSYAREISPTLIFVPVFSITKKRKQNATTGKRLIG
jgi:hypothetical protein